MYTFKGRFTGFIVLELVAIIAVVEHINIYILNKIKFYLDVEFEILLHALFTLNVSVYL